MRGFYAIVDPELCAGRAPLEVADAILRGGCAALQLRAKNMPDDARLELAHELRALCAGRRVPFIMNDRADLAMLAGADGLHLGQDDIAIHDARRIVGRMQIGLSTHDVSQALDAVARGADVIGFGPVYDTQSKARPDRTVGLAGVREVCARVNVPVVAIGGITIQRTPDVVAAGAQLVAAIAAVCGAPDPEAAARAMHRAARGAP